MVRALVLHAALHRLPDPPRRVRRELEAPAPVELLDGADEPDDALLDEIEEREAVPLVPLGDRDDEAQVRVDHPLLRLEVAALDPLGELDLLLGRQERIAADLVEEQLEAVRGRSRERAVRVVGVARAGALAVVRDLDVAVVELLVQAADGLVVELELLRSRTRARRGSRIPRARRARRAR